MSKTANELVNYCKAMIGLPYWWGTFGQIASKDLYESKKKQYPSYYIANDFKSQYGKRVHDCIGLIKGFIWSDSTTSKPKYNSDQDVGACKMYSLCKTRGNYTSFPNTVGALIFKGNSTDSIYHVGVYIGNNYVIEANSHSKGVIKSKYNSNWRYWGLCPWIDYTNKDNATTTTTKKKSNLTIAIEVFNGDWGNNPERKTKLINAGYNYNYIQALVNDLYKNNGKSIDVAKDVINGYYGDMPKRKTNLEKAGYDYNYIQTLVNYIKLG